ncbi:MAG: M23 family metallopeptidase [Gemmatimonadota bacterium]
MLYLAVVIGGFATGIGGTLYAFGRLSSGDELQAAADPASRQSTLADSPDRRDERTGAGNSPFAEAPLRLVSDPVPAAGTAPDTPSARRPWGSASASVVERLDTLSADSIAVLVEELRDRRLLVPAEGVAGDVLRDNFHDARGQRTHHAMDIMAPRNTPVLAVENGTIAKLHTSEAGGITIYQFDASQTFGYYYAHLDRYAAGLKQGDAVKRGEVIGYVGSTGNATTPHVHFAISLLHPDKRWWEGIPLNPYSILR